MIGRALRSLQLRLLDAADHVSGRADPLVPPRRLNDFVGDSDFRATGDEFLRLLVELAELEPQQRVLDVGCGIGRLARPLAGYLRPPGAYEGFDIVPDAIAWCRRHYAGYPHFGFTVAEVSNGLYRPVGGIAARDYTFPFPDAGFDLSLATSVFTHLLPDEADRYLAEMARVTRPQGRVFITLFVLDGETPRPRGGAGERLSFPHDHGHFATDSQDVPEAAVAYTEGWLRERLAAHALLPVGPLHHGTWSGRADGLSLQDIVIARPG